METVFSIIMMIILILFILAMTLLGLIILPIAIESYIDAKKALENLKRKKK